MKALAECGTRRRAWFLSLFLVLAPAAAQQEPADALLLSWSRSHALLPGLDDAPLVEVYASGRVVVRRPAGYLNAGLAETRLAADDLQRLLALARSGLATARVRSPVRSDPDGSVRATRDATVTTIDVVPSDDPDTDADAFAPPSAPGALAIRPGLQRVEIVDLRGAADGSSDPALVALDAASRRLADLFDAPVDGDGR